MVQARELFRDSGDAVFAIDAQQRICYVNAAFVRLLGRPEGEILGHPCSEVLCADDLAQRPVCSAGCTIARQAIQSEPLQNLDLVIKGADGDRCWVNVGAYPVPALGRGGPRVYFALRPVSGHRLIRQLASELGHVRPSDRPPSLTPREAEILSLAARGLNTAGIGQQLCIAPQTVRNHFKNIFTKLEVGSRAQAVALALRHQLV